MSSSICIREKTAPVQKCGPLPNATCAPAVPVEVDPVGVGEDRRIAVRGEVRDVHGVTRADADTVEIDVLRGDPGQADGSPVRDVAQELLDGRGARRGVVAQAVQQVGAAQQEVEHLAGVVGDGLSADLERAG